jgi:hypothetical protein
MLIRTHSSDISNLLKEYWDTSVFFLSLETDNRCSFWDKNCGYSEISFRRHNEIATEEVVLCETHKVKVMCREVIEKMSVLNTGKSKVCHDGEWTKYGRLKCWDFLFIFEGYLTLRKTVRKYWRNRYKNLQKIKIGNVRINVTLRSVRLTTLQGKSNNYHIFWVCVCVTLIAQHAMRMHRSTILWPVWLYDIFPHYLINGKIFGGKKCYWP